MSIIHTILPKQALNISQLNQFVTTIDDAVYEDRGNGIYYYWIAGKSTRGFDITLEQDSIEVRNTVLSNHEDYELTNKIVAEILRLTDGILLDEDEEQVTSLPLFSEKAINELELSDCGTILTLAKENGDIAIYGPMRKVHFGKRLHSLLEMVNKEVIRRMMFNTILKVNYEIPNFEYGNVMRIGNTEEDKKILKLLTNTVDCLIDKYDYILFEMPNGNPIMITNAVLNTMLPSNWVLVDEFTIVAPITSQAEWNTLVANAKKQDCYNDFVNN